MINWSETKNLWATDEDTFFTACQSAGLTATDDDGVETITKSSHNHALIIVGTLYEDSGETATDSEGNEYAVQTALDGYHANLRYRESVGLEDLEIEVDDPKVKFG